MKFNASKCQIMRIHRSTKSLEILYTLHKRILAYVSRTTYLEVITETLDMSLHINSIVTKANLCLGFINRNISNCL